MFERFLCFALAVFIPTLNVFGASPELSRLINEKNKKMAKLEQCAKKVSGFKIAGISTLGLTAAGAVGNIMLHKKSTELTNQIDSTKKNIEAEKQKKVKLEEDIEKQKQKQADCRAKMSANPGRWEYKDGECKEIETTTQTTTVNTKNTTTSETKANAPKIDEECIYYDNEPFLEQGFWKEYTFGEETCVNSDGVEVRCICSATKCFGGQQRVHLENEIYLCEQPEVVKIGGECNPTGENVSASKWVAVSEKTDYFCVNEGKAFYCACSATKCKNENYELVTGNDGVSTCAEKKSSIDMSELKNPTKADITQDDFCKDRALWYFGQKATVYSPNIENWKNMGVSYGYWCKRLFGSDYWVVGETNGTFSYKCNKDISADDCKKSGKSNSSSEISKSSKDLLAEYKNYEITGDETKDNFRVQITGVDGVSDILDNLDIKCEEKNRKFKCIKMTEGSGRDAIVFQECRFYEP